MCRQPGNLQAFVEAQKIFQAKLDAQSANAVVVKVDALDSTIRARLPPVSLNCVQVAQATAEAIGGNLLSGMLRILSIDDDGDRDREVEGFLRRHFNRLLSRADSKAAAAEDVAVEMMQPFRPISECIEASQQQESEHNDAFNKLEPELVEQLLAAGA